MQEPSDRRFWRRQLPEIYTRGVAGGSGCLFEMAKSAQADWLGKIVEINPQSAKKRNR
jgi:hypothetical protein